MANEIKKKKRFYISLWFWIVIAVLAVWFIVHDMKQATIKTNSMSGHSVKSVACANQGNIPSQSLSISRIA